MIKKIKVMIVDDSAVVRQVVSAVLSEDNEIEVIATAADPIFALRRMEKEWPDVILLDIEMPRMDGVTFLKKIMAERPTPIIICSSLTARGAEATMQALAAGAVNIIAKANLGVKNFLEDASTDIVSAVKTAAKARVAKSNPEAVSVIPKHTADAILPSPAASSSITRTTQHIVAIGTSTGGTQALEKILTKLPPTCPGIVIVQHMPEKFTTAFAERLNDLCELTVREACNGDCILPGHAFIAPGGRHMLVKRCGTQYYVEVVDGPFVNRHRPSVDVLFRSVAHHAGKNAMGIIMTGMGDDGARGLKEMFDAGAYTVAQDEESCVVFGMPKEAIKLGGVTQVLSLAQLPREILTNAPH